jgi:hypothetical protein
MGHSNMTVYRMLRRVVSQKLTDVSEVLIASIIKAMSKGILTIHMFLEIE